MATLKLHQPIDMNTLQAWDGRFTIIGSHQIRVTDDVKTQDYFGDFQFSSEGIISGTLTSTTAYQNGLYYEVTDLNVDAPTMAGYIENFDIGSALNEVLKGDDTIIGSAGNDVIKGGTGNDTIDGGNGIDKVIYNSNSGLIVTNTAVANGPAYAVTVDGKIDVISNVERIGFGDGSTLALDVGAGENAGSAYRLYQAAFDRQPDNGGLKWWINQLDNGMSLTQAAQGFVDSAEFKKLNPSQDPKSIITSYYQNVLNRAPDAGGLKYWEDAMASGNTNAAHMLASFSESAENISNTSPAFNGGLWLF